MKKITKKFLDISTRYMILVLIALPGLSIFYFIFTPLTVNSTFFLLDLLYEASLRGNVINLMNNFFIEIIAACVAGSAYYLLLILNMSIQKIKLKKRLGHIFLAFLSYFIINILRILVLSVLYVNKFSLFDIAHRLFWYLGSIVFVAAIWFAEVKLFKIREIPFYEDIKFLYKKSR